MAKRLPGSTPLDMQEFANDDLYIGCEDKMFDDVKAKLLVKERASNPQYDKAWRNAEAEVKPDGKIDVMLARAIHVYTSGRPSVYKPFNLATRKEKTQSARQFNYKSLHFLLTMAVRTLKKGDKCLKTYRGINIASIGSKGDLIRFGQFTSSSISKKVTKDFGEGTVFEIRTCYGAPLGKYSQYPQEEEVLIPPSETFEIVDIKRVGKGKLFVLESRGLVCQSNCALIRPEHRKYWSPDEVAVLEDEDGVLHFF